MVAKLEQNILKKVAEYYNLANPKLNSEEIILLEFEDLLQGYGRENKEHLAGVLNRRLEITLGYTLHYRFGVESEKVIE